MADGNARLLWRVRWAVGVFIFGLVVSGATAIPLEMEVRWLSAWQGPGAQWIARVREGLEATGRLYPFMGYGTDWLAFGHFAIAIIYIGAWREPVRNRWLFDAGLILCTLVVVYAMVFGQMRGIPLGWRLIDCSFGVFGAVPLWLGRKWVGEIQTFRSAAAPSSLA